MTGAIPSRLVAATMLLVLVGIVLFLGSSQPKTIGLASLYTWGSQSSDYAASVKVDALGNVYVAGNTYGFGGGISQVLLLKYVPDHRVVWQKVWGDAHPQGGTAVAVDGAENVYITGLGTFLLKVNSTGALVWQKAWNVSGYQTDGYAAAADSNGSVYISGMLNYYNGTQYLVLLKFSSDGSLIWQNADVGAGVSGWGVAVDSAGSIYVAGQGRGSAVLLKFNSTGSLQWHRSWLLPGSNGESATSVATDTAGNVVVGGRICGCSTGPSGYQSFNATISKFDGNGSMIWHRAWKDTTQGLYPDARISQVAVDVSGDVYATGFSDGTFLMELDSSGNLLSLNRLIGGPSSAGGVAVDLSGTPITVGSIYSPPSNYHAQALSPSLDLRLPQLNATAGALRSLHYPLVNLTGTLMDVNGSTSYAGGGDVFLNYGLSFPLPAFNPVQLILAISSVMMVTRRISRRYRSLRL